MERLTTNKDVSEMSMIELAHNSCYIKDGKARYRDFNKDWNTRDFVRDILLESCLLNDEDKEIQDDHAFDETLLDYLQYSHRTIGGLIGLLYRNLWAMAELRERLKDYEDLEEQGLLLRLPCKVGYTIYYIEDNVIYEFIVYSLTQKYCCRKCGDIFRRTHKGTLLYPSITFSCSQCGKTVVTEDGSGDMRTRFCSASCEKKFWRHPHWENSHTRMNFRSLDEYEGYERRTNA